MLTRRRTIQVIVFSILFGLCAYSYFKWIDSRITVDYMIQEQKYQEKTIALLKNVLEKTAVHMNRSEMNQFITKNYYETHIIREEKDEIYLDNIIFVFRGDSLIAVKEMND